jgi:hypothetical protein
VYVWYLGVPNSVFPGARTVVPIAISPEPPPHVPGSFVFSEHFDTWYTENVLEPGLVKKRDVRRLLNEIWASQKRFSAILRTFP